MLSITTGAVTSGTTAPGTLHGLRNTCWINNSEIELYDTQSYANGSPFLTLPNLVEQK